MARYIGARGRVARRLGIPLSSVSSKESSKDPYVRRPYPPGQHGPTARPRETPFAARLREKQRLRFLYGILETQCRRYFRKAQSQTGVTGDNLLRLLEQRLDSVVYRSGFATSMRQARQLVNHGHVRVDGRTVNVASFHVKPGATIEIANGSRRIPWLAEATQTQPAAPPYLEVEFNRWTASLTRRPDREEIPVDLAANLVVEYYAQRS